MFGQGVLGPFSINRQRDLCIRKTDVVIILIGDESPDGGNIFSATPLTWVFAEGGEASRRVA